MNKYFNYTKDGIEVDVTKAMHHGDKKKEESKSMMHAPDISKHYFKTKEEAMNDAEKWVSKASTLIKEKMVKLYTWLDLIMRLS